MSNILKLDANERAKDYEAEIIASIIQKSVLSKVSINRYPDAKAIEIEGALNDAAQQDLVTAKHQLISVNAPGWLHIKAMAPKIISPKPKFIKLD